MFTENWCGLGVRAHFFPEISVQGKTIPVAIAKAEAGGPCVIVSASKERAGHAIRRLMPSYDRKYRCRNQAEASESEFEAAVGPELAGYVKSELRLCVEAMLAGRSPLKDNRESKGARPVVLRTAVLRTAAQPAAMPAVSETAQPAAVLQTAVLHTATQTAGDDRLGAAPDSSGLADGLSDRRSSTADSSPDRVARGHEMAPEQTVAREQTVVPEHDGQTTNCRTECRTECRTGNETVPEPAFVARGDVAQETVAPEQNVPSPKPLKSVYERMVKKGLFTTWHLSELRRFMDSTMPRMTGRIGYEKCRKMVCEAVDRIFSRSSLASLSDRNSPAGLADGGLADESIQPKSVRAEPIRADTHIWNGIMHVAKGQEDRFGLPEGYYRVECDGEAYTVVQGCWIGKSVKVRDCPSVQAEA